MRRRAIIESLERRQLLSAGPGGGAGGDAASELLDAISAHVVLPLHASRPPVSAAARAAPTAPPPIAAELVGNFAGKVRHKLWFGAFEYRGFLTITEVTATGMTATLSIASNVDGTATASGVFTGRVNRKGGFAFRLREPGQRASLRGKIVPENDRLVGAMRVKQAGTDLRGSFKLDRRFT